MVVGSEYDLRRPVERGLAVFSRILVLCWPVGRGGSERGSGIVLFELLSSGGSSVAAGFGAHVLGFTPPSTLLLGE